jgi:hypothetical protein
MHMHYCETCKFFVKGKETLWENDLCMKNKPKSMSKVNQFDIKLSPHGCKVWANKF